MEHWLEVGSDIWWFIKWPSMIGCFFVSGMTQGMSETHGGWYEHVNTLSFIAGTVIVFLLANGW